MQDLTPVGLSEDGERLFLTAASGEEFAVPVDARLRKLLGKLPGGPPHEKPSRSGKVEKQMQSTLRPRDIQARIRSGESAEEVAAAAGTSVESIMGFATPVLAERAHVAQGAQRASVRRSGESAAAGRTLGEAAEIWFAEHGLHDEDVEWDAWRRPDGRWALVARFAVGGAPRSAEFTHDVPGRFVLAENDDARILTGELQEPGTPAAEVRPARRLSAVPADDELPLGDDAIELVRDRSGEPTPPDAEPELPTSEDTQPVVLDDDVEEQTDADHETGPDAGEDPEAAVRQSGSGRRKGRSSVPSWDEIMFGGGPQD